MPILAEIMDLLDQGCSLITPGARLSRYYRHLYARRQLQVGRRAWPTPDILPWSGWLQRTWESMVVEQGLKQIVLGSHQQEHLWREIISRSTAGKHLLQPAATAREAINAWSLCQEWLLPIESDNFKSYEDARAFREWSAAYRKRCGENQWLDESVLAAALECQVQLAATFIRTPLLALAGFDTLTPAQRTLLDKLQGAGVRISVLSGAPVNASITLSAFHDSREEIRAAAHWSRQLLEADPAVRVGIVCPHLHASAIKIQNIFDDVFFPGAILAGAVEPQRPYALALGRPLASYPLIDSALLILALAFETVPLNDLGALLRSPFVGGSVAESRKRAQFDAALRRHGEPRVSLDGVNWLLTNHFLKEHETPEQFLGAWKALRACVPAQEQKQAASSWARLYVKLLKIMHWPGERQLSSAEYQTAAEWQEQLQKFAALDLVTPTLTALEALRMLRQLVQNTSYQPETAETPIQILGLTGVAAMELEHLWIMGLHAEAWPGRADPNPFIPLALQRAASIPGATPEATLEQAQDMTRRLISSATHVRLSYPRTENERALHRSPLLQDYQELVNPELYPGWSEYAGLMYEARVLEAVVDVTAPALPAGSEVRGGASLFKDQAACPFRACARHRLQAEGLDTRDLGLDARMRGSLLHNILETLWEKLGGSRLLQELSPAQTGQIIQEFVSAAVASQCRQFPQTCGPRFARNETGRLCALVQQLLELERTRQPFTVRSREQQHDIECNGITVSTRIDRIDELADGSIVILDYKTGIATINQWYSDRPDDPQLPLYAIIAKGELAALAFVRLQKDNVAWIGLARETDLLPGLKTVDAARQYADIGDWASLIAGWRVTLERLASDFRQGIAVVDPKNGESCRQCDLHSLCRIYELQKGFVARDSWLESDNDE